MREAHELGELCALVAQEALLKAGERRSCGPATEQRLGMASIVCRALRADRRESAVLRQSCRRCH